MSAEFTTTKDGRAIRRNNRSIIDEVLTCVESGLSIDETIVRCTPLYVAKYEDRVGQPNFEMWINKRIKVHVNWAKRKVT